MNNENVAVDALSNMREEARLEVVNLEEKLSGLQTQLVLAKERYARIDKDVEGFLRLWFFMRYPSR